MFLIAVSAKYKTKPSEHCGSGGFVFLLFYLPYHQSSLISQAVKYETSRQTYFISFSLCIVSTTLILNSGVYLLFGFPFGIKMPLLLDLLLVYFYYTTLSNKRGAFQPLASLSFDYFIIKGRFITDFDEALQGYMVNLQLSVERRF